MPVIEKPDELEPLFGSRPCIVIGGPLVHQWRQWKKRKTAASTRDRDGSNP
jgi:hypothetical protein